MEIREDAGPKKRVRKDPKGKPNCLKTGWEWKWQWQCREDAGPGKEQSNIESVLTAEGKTKLSEDKMEMAMPRRCKENLGESERMHPSGGDWFSRNDATAMLSMRPCTALPADATRVVLPLKSNDTTGRSICVKTKGYLRGNTRAARAGFHGMMRQQCCRCDHVQPVQADVTSVDPRK
jgi:hypothetical protein